MSFVDYCFSVLRTQEFVQLNCYVTSTGTLSIFFSSIITVVSRTLGILLTLFINSNRTVWSPIRSVIIRVNKRTSAKWESDLLITKLDSTQSCYQLIKAMTKFEKETKHRLYVFIKEKNQLTRRNARH